MIILVGVLLDMTTNIIKVPHEKYEEMLRKTVGKNQFIDKYKNNGRWGTSLACQLFLADIQMICHKTTKINLNIIY